MKWGVFEVPGAVHVLPLRDDGEPFFHVIEDDCLREPVVEHNGAAQGTLPLFIHAATNERRRNVLRAWNLRRELRGKHGRWR